MNIVTLQRLVVTVLIIAAIWIFLQFLDLSPMTMLFINFAGLAAIFLIIKVYFFRA